MGRWRRHLDPSVKKDAWTDDEDAKLLRLHESLGPRWSNISKMLTGRTAQQCRARWFQLSAAEEEGGEDGTTTVTVTVKSEEGSARGGKKQRKTPSEPLSPSTPAVTDEDGTVSAIKSEGASSKKRKEAAEKAAEKAAAAPKRRRTLKDAVAAKSETAEAENGSSAGSPNLYGNGGGLDMLAMLYSAAVTYEQGFAAAGGTSRRFPRSCTREARAVARVDRKRRRKARNITLRAKPARAPGRGVLSRGPPGFAGVYHHRVARRRATRTHSFILGRKGKGDASQSPRRRCTGPARGRREERLGREKQIIREGIGF